MRHDLGCSTLVAGLFKKKTKKSSVAYEGLSHEEAANRGHDFNAALCAHACSGATSAGAVQRRALVLVYVKAVGVHSTRIRKSSSRSRLVVAAAAVV